MYTSGAQKKGLCDNRFEGGFLGQSYHTYWFYRCKNLRNRLFPSVQIEWVILSSLESDWSPLKPIWSHDCKQLALRGSLHSLPLFFQWVCFCWIPLKLSPLCILARDGIDEAVSFWPAVFELGTSSAQAAESWAPVLNLASSVMWLVAANTD